MAMFYHLVQWSPSEITKRYYESNLLNAHPNVVFRCGIKEQSNTLSIVSEQTRKLCGHSYIFIVFHAFMASVDTAPPLFTL